MGYTSKIIKPVLIVGYWYVKTFTNLFNIGYEPVLNFIGNYSPTLQKSLDEIVPTIYKFILSLPLVLPIILFSAFVMGDITSIQSIINLYSELTNMESTFQTSLTFIIGLFGLSIIILSSVYNMNNSIKMSGLVILSAIPILYLDTPNVYVYIATLAFSIGAYSTTIIEFKFSKSVTNILDEDEPHVNSQAYTFLYGVFTIPLILLINMNITPEVTFVLTLILSLVAYLFISIQKDVYKTIYNHVRADKSSRVFMYPARVSIVYAIGITLIMQSVTMFITLLYFIPAIMFLSFSHYITKDKTDMIVSTKQLSDENRKNGQISQKIQGGIKPELSQLDYDKTSPNEGSTELKFNMHIKIPEEMNPNENVWKTYLKTVNNVENIMGQIKTEDKNVDMEEYNSFQDEVIVQALSEFKTYVKSLQLYDLPKELLNKIQKNMYKLDSYNMDDISEVDIIIHNKKLESIDDNKYIEK